MSERVFGVDSSLGIVDEDLAEEVQELFVEGCVRGDDILQLEKSVDVTW